MALAVVACMCGSSESLVRSFLHSVGYPEWNSIPVVRGKDKSLAVLNQLPPAPEKEMLQNFLKDASKWAVIIGYTEDQVKWSDIAHSGPKSKIEAELVVRAFSPFDENGTVL
jgi:hypothetical protein